MGTLIVNEHLKEIIDPHYDKVRFYLNARKPEKDLSLYNHPIVNLTIESKEGRPAINPAFFSTETNVMPLSTQDFTMEAWVYITSPIASNYQEFFGVTGTNGFLLYTTDGSIRFVLQGITIIDSSFSILGLSGWHHLCLCRKSSTYIFFVNGNLVSSLFSNSAQSLRSGIIVASSPVDNLRFTLGLARYEYSFNPYDKSKTYYL